MNLKECEKKANGTADIVVEVSPDEFESALGKVFIKNRNRISVPGFRKGKAPRRIVEKMYGASVFHSDALDMLIPDIIDFTVGKSQLRIIGQPQLNDVDIKDDNTGVDFSFTVTYYPEITLGEYKGLSASKPDVEVQESEIDDEIAVIRERNARFEKTNRPVIDGDIAVIDFEGFLDGAPFEGGKDEDYELTIGSNTFIPGFEEKIIGMSTGEERRLELVFPEGYEDSLSGKSVVFKVKLNEIKEKMLPDLDDEFAKDVSEFDTFEEYKADITEKLLKTKQTEADEVFENALFDKLADSVDAYIPDLMVEDQMEKSFNSFSRQVSSYGMDPLEYLKMMNMTPETFRENSRASSEKQVKIKLALEKIAELEGLVANPEEIENEYIKAAESSGKDVIELKLSAPEESVAREIRIRMASKFIIDNATVEISENKGE